MTEAVKVIVRVRPLLLPQEAGQEKVTTTDKNEVSIMNSATGLGKSFAFDAVYGDNCEQQSIYDETAFPLVESVLGGYNGTIFAYGQTGCGKTHTMTGDPTDKAQRGIIPNSFMHIFGWIGSAPTSKCFLVRCSYAEIYQEEIRDLLNPGNQRKLKLHEDADNGFYIKDMKILPVKSIADIDNAMEYGTAQRVTRSTAMNSRSSRSHAIFTIYIEVSEEEEGRQVVKAGKLNLVDLAGSERQKKTHAVGEGLKEAVKINLSLSALGNVISALVDGKVTHIPYRDSKLTRILQDSLGGNTKTVMIACISPAAYNYDESLSTLRYASRAKFIQNKPKINEDPKDALLRSYADEINRLKKLLECRQAGKPMVIEKIVEKIIHVTEEGDEIIQKKPRQQSKRRAKQSSQLQEEDYSSDEPQDMPKRTKKRVVKPKQTAKAGLAKGLGDLESDDESPSPQPQSRKIVEENKRRSPTKRRPENPEMEHPAPTAESDDDYSDEFDAQSPEVKSGKGRQIQNQKANANSKVVANRVENIQSKKSPNPTLAKGQKQVMSKKSANTTPVPQRTGKATPGLNAGLESDDVYSSDAEQEVKAKQSGMSKPKVSTKQIRKQNPSGTKAGTTQAKGTTQVGGLESDEEEYSSEGQTESAKNTPGKPDPAKARAQQPTKKRAQPANKGQPKKPTQAKQGTSTGATKAVGIESDDEDYSSDMEPESPAKPTKSSKVVEKLVEGRQTKSNQPKKAVTTVLESDDEVYSSDAREEGNQKLAPKKVQRGQVDQSKSAKSLSKQQPAGKRANTEARGTKETKGPGVATRAKFVQDSASDDDYSMAFEDEEFLQAVSKTQGSSVSNLSKNSQPKTQQNSVNQLTNKPVSKSITPAPKGSTEAVQNTNAEEQDKLDKLVSEIKNQLVQGGNTANSEALEEMQQAMAHRQHQLKLQKQKQQEQEKQKQAALEEEQFLFKEKHYSNVHDEVRDSRKIIEKLRYKYKAATSEVNDLQKEHTQERENMLENVRIQGSEIDYYVNILKSVMSEKELRLIKHRSKFDMGDNQWRVPPFLIQEKNVIFPKLSRAQAKAAMAHEKKNRELKFTGRQKTAAAEMQPNSYSNASGHFDYDEEDYDDSLRNAQFGSGLKPGGERDSTADMFSKNRQSKQSTRFEPLKQSRQAKFSREGQDKGNLYNF